MDKKSTRGLYLFTIVLILLSGCKSSNFFSQKWEKRKYVEGHYSDKINHKGDEENKSKKANYKSVTQESPKKFERKATVLETDDLSTDLTSSLESIVIKEDFPIIFCDNNNSLKQENNDDDDKDKRPTNKKSELSGIFMAMAAVIPAAIIPAGIYAYLALREIKKTNEKGRQMALIVLIVAVGIIVFSLLLMSYLLLTEDSGM